FFAGTYQVALRSALQTPCPQKGCLQILAGNSDSTKAGSGSSAIEAPPPDHIRYFLATHWSTIHEPHVVRILRQATKIRPEGPLSAHFRSVSWPPPRGSRNRLEIGRSKHHGSKTPGRTSQRQGLSSNCSPSCVVVTAFECEID